MQPFVLLLSNDAEASLGAARELNSIGVQFRIVQPAEESLLYWSRYIDSQQLVVASTERDVVDTINLFAARRPIVVIPLSDWGLEALVGNRHSFGERVRCSPFLRNNPRANLFDKAYLYSLFVDASMNLPAWHSLADGPPDRAWLDRTGDFIVKPTLKRFGNKHIYGKAIRMQSADEVQNFYAKLPENERAEWLVQERVRGEFSDTYQLDLFMRTDGTVPYICTLRNRFNAKSGFGEAAELEITDAIEPESRLIEWLRHIGYDGGINAEFMYEASTGHYRLFDLNTRPPGHYGFTHELGGRFMLESLLDFGFDGLEFTPHRGPVLRPNAGRMTRPVSVIHSDQSFWTKAFVLVRALGNLFFQRASVTHYVPTLSRDDPVYLPHLVQRIRDVLMPGLGREGTTQRSTKS